VVDALATLEEAIALQQRGEHVAAAARYEAILEDRRLPRGLELLIWHNLAAAQRASGGIQRALRCYAQALACDAEDADSWNGLGLTLADDGEPHLAARAHQRAVAIDPSAHAYLCLGNALRASDQRRPARAAFERACVLDPGLAAAPYNLHAAVYDDRSPREALAALERALAIEPEHEQARFFDHGIRRWHDLPTSTQTQTAPEFLTSSLAFVLEQRDRETRAFADTFQTLGHAVSLAPDSGEVVELGVRRGTTLRFLAGLWPDRRILGFDSFEGIPEPWGGQPRGLYSTGGEMPSMPPNVSVHPGWFEETLNEVARTGEQLALVHVDCDLRGSTQTALGALAPRIAGGTVLVFDEYLCNPGWQNEEHRAWRQAATQCDWRYRYAAFSLFTKQAVIVVED